jgi:hypothetical protein
MPPEQRVSHTLPTHMSQHPDTHMEDVPQMHHLHSTHEHGADSDSDTGNSAPTHDDVHTRETSENQRTIDFITYTNETLRRIITRTNNEAPNDDMHSFKQIIADVDTKFHIMRSINTDIYDLYIELLNNMKYAYDRLFSVSTHEQQLHFKFLIGYTETHDTFVKRLNELMQMSQHPSQQRTPPDASPSSAPMRPEQHQPPADIRRTPTDSSDSDAVSTVTRRHYRYMKSV